MREGEAVSMQTFDVTVARDGKWWVFEVPALGAAGQALKLSDVEAETHDVVATWLDVAPETVGVNISVEGQQPTSARQSWLEADRVDEAARKERARAAAMRREVVRELRGQRYSAQDVGDRLGISRQRVHQLEKAS